MHVSLDDLRPVAIGTLLADTTLTALPEALIKRREERESHIIMVTLMHAMCRHEVQTRKPGTSPAEHRADLHAILDNVLSHEERLHEALK